MLKLTSLLTSTGAKNKELQCKNLESLKRKRPKQYGFRGADCDKFIINNIKEYICVCSCGTLSNLFIRKIPK